MARQQPVNTSKYANFEHSPARKPFIIPMWDEWRQDADAPRGVYFQNKFRLVHFLMIVAVLLCMVGIFPPAQSLLPVGIALIVTLFLNYQKCWRASGDVGQEVEPLESEVQKGEYLDVAVTVHNSGKSKVAEVIFQCKFTGTTSAYQCIKVHNLRPRERRRIQFRFKADRLMGKYKVGPVKKTVIDPLRLFSLTVSNDFSHQVQIAAARTEPVSKIATEYISQAMHSGDFEVSLPGRSTTFLGLRPWANGDSINKIDWKKTMKNGELIVKDFERMSSTDATFFVDLWDGGHVDYGVISSLSAEKEAVVQVFHALMRQQIRTQIITPKLEIPFGKGPGFFHDATREIMSLEPHYLNNFKEMLESRSDQVPADSIVVLFYSTKTASFENLSEIIMRFVDRRIEVKLVIMDARSFGRAASKDAYFVSDYLSGYYSELLQKSLTEVKLQKFVGSLVESTYVLKPSIKLNHVVDQVKGF